MTETKNSPLTYLMIGGGPGSMIGAVHKTALDLFGLARLVGGSFSRTLAKSLEQGEKWGVDSTRVYETYGEMLEKEAARPDRPDFVVIVTPNNTHYPAAKMALERGFHVACDKPLCLTVAEADELAGLSAAKGLEFLVTYTYLGYPLVRQAREMALRGDLGHVRLIVAEYVQDWLADDLPDNKQAAWRTDPGQSGVAGSMGDIGAHAESLCRFVTGQDIDALSASLDTFVPGRKLDDNGFVWFTTAGGAKGSIWASQIAVGRENGLSIRVFGTRAGLEWHQENPNVLLFSPKGRPVQIMTRGQSYLHGHAGRYTHLPPGHPEGMFEAFANLYDGFVQTIQARRHGRLPSPYDLYPNVSDGAKGVRFIHAAVKSSAENNAWVRVDA